MRRASLCGTLRGVRKGGHMQVSRCAVIRQSHFIAVVGAFLIGCAVLLLAVGCAGVRSEAPQEDQQAHTQATASEEARCEGTRTFKRGEWGLITTNDISGCPNGSLLSGTEKADALDGLKGEDEIHGLGGRDVIFGGDGNDVIYSGSGDDAYLWGDAQYAGRGDDVIYGGEGNEQAMWGGGGEDVLYGGDGNDNLDGTHDGRQRDKLYCGEGRDYYS